MKQSSRNLPTLKKLLPINSILQLQNSLIKIIIAVILSVKWLGADAQQSEISVYFNCSACDTEFIKTNINFINYAVDPFDTDIYLMGNKQSAGNGGYEYSFIFTGQKKFNGTNDTISFISLPTNTPSEIRSKQLIYIKFGILRYFAKINSLENFEISYKTANISVAEKDKWKKWVFRTGGTGYFATEKSYKNIMTNASFSAEKVLEDKKIEFDFSHDRNKYIFTVNNVDVVSLNTGNSFSASYVLSISPRFSAGIESASGSSTYYNYKFTAALYPTAEYNIYPYSESTIRQLRFKFSVGYKYNFYNDTTIYNKTNEGLFRTKLSVAHRVNKNWGTVNTSLSGTIYLHDISINRLDFSSAINIRIYKGISYSAGIGASLVHDQYYLPKGNLSIEEVLLKQTQLETSYNYFLTSGFLFTFGSLYNNAVNPRF